MFEIVTTRYFQFPSRYGFPLYTCYSKTKEYRTAYVYVCVYVSILQ